MKNFKLIMILPILSLLLGLNAMESKDGAKPIIKRPERTKDVKQGLGDFGILPDDVILNIALALIDQNADQPEKAFNDLVNFAKTNKYINDLISTVSSEKDTKKKLKAIRINIAKKYLKILEDILEIIERLTDQGAATLESPQNDEEKFYEIKKYARDKNIDYLKNLITQAENSKDDFKAKIEKIEQKIKEKIDIYKKIVNPPFNLNKEFKKLAKNPKQINDLLNDLKDIEAEEEGNGKEEA